MLEPKHQIKAGKHRGRTWAEHRKGLHVASQTTRDRVAAEIAARGLIPAARLLQVSGQTLAAIATGAGVRRGSLLAVEQAIESISAPA